MRPRLPCQDLSSFAIICSAVIATYANRQGGRLVPDHPLRGLASKGSQRRPCKASYGPGRDRTYDLRIMSPLL